MPSDLRDYIASRYLVADPKPSSKKRKRKQPAVAGLLITDDDDSTWARVKARPDDEDDDPTMVLGSTAEFRKIKKSNWKRVGGGSSAVDSTNDEKAAADAILAAAAAENEAARTADDEGPVIDTGVNAVRMSDGTHAGLQNLAAVSAQLKQRRREEQDNFEKHRKSAKEKETVYRDATGRRIDISMKRAEARKAAAEAQEKELLAKEALKGQVQLEKARQEKEQLRDAKLMPFARKADDEQMNQELKEQDRWNDPMKQFLGDKKSEVSKGKASKRRPVYVGGAPPNRYGIKPGYRWDGVDRGNGSEAERFKAINRKERSKGLEYSWQMDE